MKDAHISNEAAPTPDNDIDLSQGRAQERTDRNSHGTDDLATRKAENETVKRGVLRMRAETIAQRVLNIDYEDTLEALVDVSTRFAADIRKRKK